MALGRDSGIWGLTTSKKPRVVEEGGDGEAGVGQCPSTSVQPSRIEGRTLMMLPESLV